MKILMTALFLWMGIMDINAQCYSDRHNTSLGEAWLSCSPSANPNPVRGISHWIMYDLGKTLRLGETHFWNVNIPGRTGAGIQNAVIDYSIDGSDWQEWGNFILEEAPASGFYEGEQRDIYSLLLKKITDTFAQALER